MSHQVGFGNILPPISDAATDAANSASGDLLPALNFGREKLLSSTEVEGKLKNWPTQEQASRWLARTLAASYNSVICSRCFEPVVRYSAATNSTYAGEYV